MTQTVGIQHFALWDKIKSRGLPLSFGLEITARCNNNCRHCYVNLPAGDRVARERELSLGQIDRIAGEAAEMGALWCLVTGGEPLLRPDFADLYLALRRKGLLVEVFTNACLVTDEHVALFRRHPPRDIEVSVYGASLETYEAVTRQPGSYAAFLRGLGLLREGGVPVRLKAMALRSNVHELPAMAEFCRRWTADYYRFDPVLHLRTDGDPVRNAEIRAERLPPGEIAALERDDPERFQSLQDNCDALILDRQLSYQQCAACTDRDGCQEYAAFSRLFGCGVGTGSFYVSYDGTLRLCSALTAPGTTADLHRVSVREAWEELVPRVRALRTDDKTLLKSCKSCPYVNLCLWCPAHAYLETGSMEGETPYFCAVAHARAQALGVLSSAEEDTDL